MHQAIALPGTVSPAALAYAAPRETLADGDVKVVGKDLEVYATSEPPPGYSLEAEIEGVVPAADGDRWLALYVLCTLDPADAAQTREFELRSRRINGEEMDQERIDTVVSKGTTEVWEVENGHGQPHTFDVHDVLPPAQGSSALTSSGGLPP
jgi:FtsP/CotA-like multicopper oxidase with cupredoxin domain